MSNECETIDPQKFLIILDLDLICHLKFVI
jgi:hypothetical protein